MKNEEEGDEQCRQLLRSLKATAEGLLVSHAVNVWSVYGGLGRLHAAVLKILQHGLRVFTQQGEPDCWVFVDALRWLQPSLANSPPFRSSHHPSSSSSSTSLYSPCSSPPQNTPDTRCSDWLYRSIESHALSGKLSWLLSDTCHLESCYESFSFLRRQRYAEAALICLRAVEQGQPSLLTDVDPRLYLSQWTSEHFIRSHRRCSSFPDNLRPTSSKTSHRRILDTRKSLPYSRSKSAGPIAPLSLRSLHRQWHSEPCLHKPSLATEVRVRSRGRSATAVDMKRRHASTTSTQKFNSLISFNYGDIQGLKSSSNSDASHSEVKASKTEKSINYFEEVAQNIEDLNKTLLQLQKNKEENSFIEESTFQSNETSSNLQSLQKDSDIDIVQQSSPVLHGPTQNTLSKESKLDEVKEIESSSMLEHSDKEHVIIDTTPKRPTNLTLSQISNTDFEVVKNNNIRRFSKDSVQYEKQLTPPEIINVGIDALDISEEGNNYVSVEDSSNAGENKFEEAHNRSFKGSTSSFPDTNDSSPNQQQTYLHVRTSTKKPFAHSSPHKSSAKEAYHRKMPSDPVVLCPVTYEHIPHQATPCYTPSSSASLSPPFIPLPMASHRSLPMSRRTSEASSFLASSGRFSDPAEELGRENAHFSVSEAMIAAIERAKCERIVRPRPVQRGSSVAEDTFNSEEEDDEEISRLKQRIRMRRREKEQREKRLQSRVRRALRSRKSQQPQSLMSDGRTDTATPNTTTATDQSSLTPPSSPSSSSYESDGEGGTGVQDLMVDPGKDGISGDNLARLRDSGLSVSLASLYSEAELAPRQIPKIDDQATSSHWSRTAEGVAWALLGQFRGKALPRDSELQWLVSEQDAPQQLLPLPASWPVSPDEAEDEDMTRATQLRGNLQWAPPRPQIIFTPHPAPNRRVLLAKQGYLCAGCGMKVEPQYASKFRYCEYLGRYFCTGCHGNQLAVIPGRVLSKWDFSRCPVSSFSYRLLEQMQADAFFIVEDLNPSLFKKSRQLAKCRPIRIHLAQLRDFVVNCRFASELQEQYKKESPHLTTDPELYSMKDLMDVKSGDLMTRLQDLVAASKSHVSNCELCLARGFVCELCRSQEVIFPWDSARIVRCSYCGCCLHMACWKGSHTPLSSPCLSSPDDCPRCLRIKARHSLSADDDKAD